MREIVLQQLPVNSIIHVHNLQFKWSVSTNFYLKRLSDEEEYNKKCCNTKWPKIEHLFVKLYVSGGRNPCTFLSKVSVSVLHALTGLQINGCRCLDFISLWICNISVLISSLYRLLISITLCLCVWWERKSP